MSSYQTVVFRRADGDRLTPIPAAVWERFACGAQPLPAANERRIDLLLLTLRDGVCAEVDAISLDLDENGYRVRLDVQLDPLPTGVRVLDARNAFMRRYLAHAHQWRPSAALLQSALGQLDAASIDSLALH
jgi:hypothetical protein